MAYFYLQKKMEINAPKGILSKLSIKLWYNFSNNFSKIKVNENAEGFLISYGKCKTPKLNDGDEFAINIGKDGFIIVGADKNSLLRGYSNLLTQMENEPTSSELVTVIPVKEIHGKFSVQNRLVHLCVSRECDYNMLHKSALMSALLGYKQIVLESIGGFKIKALNGFWWGKGKSYKKIRRLISDANSLGAQVIPGFNMFGHASSDGVARGKHAILDRNPKYAPYFMPDGWVWNIRNPKVYDLLKEIRKDLYRIFKQDGFDKQYIHIGFDEPYIMNGNYCKIEEIQEFYRHVQKDIFDEGVTPMIWGDMMLTEEGLDIDYDIDGWYYAPSKNWKAIREAVDKRTIVCDWQYNIIKSPVKTSVDLKKDGFIVYGCPWGGQSWFNGTNVKCHVENAEKYGSDGVMITTWGVNKRNDNIVHGAYLMGYPNNSWSEFAGADTITATYTRKLLPSKGNFKKSGFTDKT